MTFKNFFEGLWLRVQYGHWEVGRERFYGVTIQQGRMGWGWQYFAECRRAGKRVYCGSKRIAEAACATYNDLRGTEPLSDDAILDDRLSKP